jgi:phage recombination protein Bet
MSDGKLKPGAMIAFDAEFTKNGELNQEHFTILEKAGIVPKGTPPDIIAVFAYVCKEKGLSPFSKEIYLLPFKEKQQDGSFKTNYAVVTGIDGYRKLAHESQSYAGLDAPRFDPTSDGKYKTLAELMKSGGARPETVCEVTVYRIVHSVRVPFTRPIIFKNFTTGKQKWHPDYGSPEHMFIKCAEAASIRAGFPRETSGVHVEEEMGFVGGESIAETQAEMTLEQKLTAPSSDMTPAQKQVIEDAFAKIKALPTKEEVKVFWNGNSWGARGTIIYERVMQACIDRGKEIDAIAAAASTLKEFSDEDKEVIETTSTVLPMYKTADEVDGYFAQSNWGGEGTDLYLEIQKMCADRKAQIAQGGGAK